MSLRLSGYASYAAQQQAVCAHKHTQTHRHTQTYTQTQTQTELPPTHAHAYAGEEPGVRPLNLSLIHI
eukprot:143837-Rhodomonas_salina.2